MLYEDVFQRLNTEGIDYLVVGGVALVLHGVVRLTADLDLMILLEETNISKFIEVMEELGYKPKAPVSARSIIEPEARARLIEEKNMTVFSFFHPEEAICLIDIFIKEPVDYTTLKNTSVRMTSGKVEIPVVSIDGLIALKKISGRPQDLADIAALEEVKRK